MLRVEDASFEVKKGRKKLVILDDVSFSVKSGELVVITGPNGSGKSTLAKIIAGIETLSNGKIILNGQNISTKDCTERARMGIAYSLQTPVHFKGLTVRDLLQIASTSGETFCGENLAEVSGLLEKVGLDSGQYLDREINNSLSGGELKRVEIASVIARNAKLVIFDEPEAGIDIWSFNNLIKVFNEMRKNSPECAIVIISHQERIMKMANRILLLKNGKIAFDGSSGDAMKMMRDAQ